MSHGLRLLLAFCLLATSDRALGQEAEDVALHAKVLDVMTRRCSPCHAPPSDDTKAMKKWALSHDLAATLEIEDMIEPGDPEVSDVYLWVVDGDMPPPDWEGGMCTADELEAVRSWIERGAWLPPAPEVVEDEGVTKVDEPTETTGPIRSPWRSWLGKLHPAVVHFPIGLLLAAVLADLLAARAAARFCLWAGALGGAGASALGWIAGETQRASDLLELHRWVGIATCVLASITALIYSRCTRNDQSPGKARWLLFVLALLVSATGHFGGELSWGEGYLDPPFGK